MIPYTVNSNSIVFFYNGKQHTYNKLTVNYNDIVSAVLANDVDLLERSIKVDLFIAKVTLGDVVITEDDEVYFRGTQVNPYLSTRIVEHYNEDPRFVQPLVKFTEKLMSNPNVDVRNDLFQWLERGSMPIYPDGDFIAYKLVREDFSPIANGPYGRDQSPGTIVTMPREKCNSNRNDTCAEGLHFCSYEYLPIFQEWNNNQGNKVIVLKINPADVVAIPTDYNLSKGRTCRFEVISEIDPNKIYESFGNKLVLSSTLVDTITDEVWEDDHSEENVNVVDSNDEDLSINTRKENEVNWYKVVTDEIAACNGNKSQAARNLGLARSTLYDILKKGDRQMSDRQYAEYLIAKNGGNKTAAAQEAGVSRKTIYKWLAS